MLSYDTHIPMLNQAATCFYWRLSGPDTPGLRTTWIPAGRFGNSLRGIWKNNQGEVFLPPLRGLRCGVFFIRGCISLNPCLYSFMPSAFSSLCFHGPTVFGKWKNRGAVIVISRGWAKRNPRYVIMPPNKPRSGVKPTRPETKQSLPALAKKRKENWRCFPLRTSLVKWAKRGRLARLGEHALIFRFFAWAGDFFLWFGFFFGQAKKKWTSHRHAKEKYNIEVHKTLRA